MIHSFNAIVDERSKVLILGSIPSITSLEKVEYYGYKHNRFWKIIQAYFDEVLDTYEDKLVCIQKHGIALWDVIQHCDRKGSLDSAITSVVVNDVESLIKHYPNIQCIICNGKKSKQLYDAYFKQLNITIVGLPSTSNANQTMKQDELFELWFNTLKQYL